MQMTLFPDDRAARLVRVHRSLRRYYGQPPPHRLLDPVSQLVMGLIGGKTRGEVSLDVFVRLAQGYGTWEALRDAPVAEIENHIAAVTFAERKARRLKAALQAVTASQGRLSLDVLQPMSVGAALGWLERLPGVGRKTAATVLNFSTLRKPALVIDTHHLRVMRRLGLVRPRALTEEAFDRLSPLLPAKWTAALIDDHHQLVKSHGQRTCCSVNPGCSVCPLGGDCAQAPAEVSR